MNEATLLDQLTNLGLSRYEATAYLGLLKRSSFSAAELATHTGVPRQRIYDVLQSLSTKGLAHERVGQRRTFVAVAPEQALATLMRSRRESMEQELYAAEALAATLAHTIQPLYAAGSDEDNPLHYIDVITDTRQIGARAVELAYSAEHEILVCFKRPLLSSLEENLEEVREPLQRGVRYRAVYEQALLNDPEMAPLIEEFVTLGQVARTVSALPLKMNIYDQRAVLLSFQDPVTGRPSITALCLTHPSLAVALTRAFESYWHEGTALFETALAPHITKECINDDPTS